MKKIILLFLLFTGIVNGQIISFPDANFKNALTSTICADYNGDRSPDTDADTNNDGEIDVSEATAVTTLVVSNANITDLSGIENFVNLIDFRCDHNQLTSLDVTPLTHLIWLTCQYNSLTTINLSNLTDLIALTCNNNNLTTIDTSDLVSLRGFRCNDNQITAFDLSNNTNLLQAFFGNNLFSSVDFSATLADPEGDACVYDCSNNPNLTYVNLKNGITQFYVVQMFNVPNLQYMCARESHIQNIHNQAIVSSGNPLIQVNSYCSFVPGGAYNTITGNIKYDFNSNGCDGSDATNSNIKVKINDGTNQGLTFTNDAGDYTFYTQAGNFTVSPVLEIPDWFDVAPESVVVNFPDVNFDNISTQDFCIAPGSPHYDLEIVIIPIMRARPGFDAIYEVLYRNKGNQIHSETEGLNLGFNGIKMSFVSASTPVSSSTSHSLAWSFTNLLPFETRKIFVTFHINAPTDTNPVNIDDVLEFNGYISPGVIEEETPDDNQFNYSDTVIGSLDPNEIICLEGSVVAPTSIGNYLHYNINFENTGTADAENIVIVDQIDTAKYNLNSFQMLDSSAPATVRINGNKVEIAFRNIRLPPSNGNPIGGHGNVLFKIQSLGTLVTGDSVSTGSDIYFDYNFPVETNDATTTFALLNNQSHTKDRSIRIFPNPSKNIVNITADNVLQRIELYDVQGRLLEAKIGSNQNNAIDISNRQKGIYFIKITTEKGNSVEKIVRE